LIGFDKTRPMSPWHQEQCIPPFSCSSWPGRFRGPEAVVNMLTLMAAIRVPSLARRPAFNGKQGLLGMPVSFLVEPMTR
jgi:hypothetical protein